MNQTEILQDAAQWIAEHKEEMVADLQSFARIPSVSREDLGQEGAPFGPDCKKMLDYALEYGKKAGFSTMNHEGYCGSVYFGDPENAIGFFGHLDVVPEGDKWIYPPYGATRVGDFLIGRGVSDNKGACVMALYVMKYLAEKKIPLKHGIRVILGCSEETGMGDMEHFSATQTMPVVSFVPDAGFPVNYAQKGMMRGTISIPKGDMILTMNGGEVRNMVPPHCMAEIDVPFEEAQKAIKGEGISLEKGEKGTIVRAAGVAAHAAGPENGKSAILMLARALEESGLLQGESMKTVASLRALCDDYYGKNVGIDCEDPESGKTTIVYGVIKTTEDGKLTLSVDSRLSIASDLEKVNTSFRAKTAEFGFAIEDLKVSAPFYMPKDDPRVVALMSIYKEATGRDDEPYTMGGGTYSRELKNAITFGPGMRGEEHRPEGLPEGHGGGHAPDEYQYIPCLVKALPIYVASVVAMDAIV